MREFLTQRDQLTNETLKGLFKNNFALVNQAINLARYYMKAGHEVKLSKLLHEVKLNPSEHYLADLQEIDKEENSTL